MGSRAPVFVVGAASAERERLAQKLGERALVEVGMFDGGGPAPCSGVWVVDANTGAERGARLRMLTTGIVVGVGRGDGLGGEAHKLVPATESDLTEVEADRICAELVALADTRPIVVALGERTYRVDIATGEAGRALGDTLTELDPTAVVLVSDEVVAPIVLPKVERAFDGVPKVVRVTIATGEKHKTLATVEQILRAAIEAPVDRRAVVVGVGGGVVTDIAGLAAALALRGVRWVAVPTTMLGMVDASVGGKTAVDLGAAKNAVGAFHQPTRVIIDPELTRTETARAFRSGLAEVVKTALIGDAELYAYLDEAGANERLGIHREREAVAFAVRRAVAVKAGVVGRDEKESGERAHLNFGHTIGHALEAEGNFERLTHGEAVSLGMVAALGVGVRLGITPPGLAKNAIELLARLGLPTALAEQPLERAMRWVGFDKKRSGRHIKFVVVRSPGCSEIVPLDGRALGELVLG